MPDGVDIVMPTDTRTVSIELCKPIAMEEGQRLAVREGNEMVGAGRVLQIMTQKKRLRGEGSQSLARRLAIA